MAMAETARSTDRTPVQRNHLCLLKVRRPGHTLLHAGKDQHTPLIGTRSEILQEEIHIDAVGHSVLIDVGPT
jgi:hypothetical protein